MIYQPNTTIPLGVFAPVGVRCRMSLGATGHLIDLSLAIFGITQWQLSHLLGVAPENIYKWLDGRYQPSTIYMARLSALCFMQLQGLTVSRMGRIFWEDSLIMWRDGSVTCENHLPGGSGALSKEEGKDRWDVAQILIEQRRYAGSFDHRKSGVSANGAHPPEHLARSASDPTASPAPMG